ncbi:unnamed protein product [Phytophthora lilii]|uniref:Unnamed protein product n=1 Tax=Phytophthora lilii TaxID=2077276 RepID=A0A9W6TMD9_9STRA|nr:unnamed protein product [Phytophthora lilii]
MDLTQKDVKAKIPNFFDSMKEVIEVHGLGVSLRNNVKLKCKVLAENMRPATLKDQVKRAIEYDPSLKANVHRLFDLIKQEAIRNQQAFDLYQRTDKRDQSNRDSRIQAKKLNHTGTHNRGGDRPSRLERNLKQLEPPVRGKAVGGAYITCTEFVELAIGLQTMAGRVNICGLTCIITETDDDEFLLGSETFVR